MMYTLISILFLSMNMKVKSKTKTITNTALTIAVVALLLSIGLVFAVVPAFRKQATFQQLTFSRMVCTDSDGGRDYQTKGVMTYYAKTGKVTKDDWCANQSTLNEYVCEDNTYKGSSQIDCRRFGEDFSCVEGRCKNRYTIYQTTNEAEGFDFIDLNADHYKEKDIPIIAVKRDNFKVLVPENYESLAMAHIEDLMTCVPLLSDFFGGIDFPEEEIAMKIYISNDESNRGSSVFGKIIYRRSQFNIDLDLKAVNQDWPDGFLYESSSNYCANTHELTHAFFNDAPLPSFGDEALAQFTQKHNQGDIFEWINCQDHGYYDHDDWYDYSDMSAEYRLDYNTAMCFMQELVETYGWDQFYQMLNRLNKFQTGDLVWDRRASYHFVKDVLEYTYGRSVLDVLTKYGINEEDYGI